MANMSSSTRLLFKKDPGAISRPVDKGKECGPSSFPSLPVGWNAGSDAEGRNPSNDSRSAKQNIDPQHRAIPTPFSP